MAWNIIVHTELGCIETFYEGKLSGPELKDAVRATFEFIKKNEIYKLLGNCTMLEGGHSIIDLFSIAKTIQDSGIAHLLKEAVLLPALTQPRKDVSFWETTGQNRGINIQLFRDREKAIQWLQS